MARSIFGTPNGASFWYNSTVKKIVLILGLALVGWACAAEEPHVAEIIAALTESVAKLRVADADVVPSHPMFSRREPMKWKLPLAEPFPAASTGG